MTAGEDPAWHTDGIQDGTASEQKENEPLSVYPDLSGAGSPNAIIASGNCGEPAWELYGDGTLVISGNGTIEEDKTTYGSVWDGLDVRKVIINPGITAIGNNAFKNLAQLSQVTLPESIGSIGNAAFMGCASLSQLSLPEGFRQIGIQTFSGCTGLECIYVPETLAGVGYAAFENCNALGQVIYSGSKKQWSWVNISMNNAPLSRAAVSCKKQDTPDSITLSETDIYRCSTTLAEDVPITLSVSCDLYKKAFSSLTAESGDQSVAEVVFDSDNPDTHTRYFNITLKGFGTTEITVSAPDGSVVEKCLVRAVEFIPLESIYFPEESVSMNAGETLALPYMKVPENAVVTSEKWGTSNEAVAEVDPLGNVTAKAPGTAAIYVNADERRAGYLVNVFQTSTGISLKEESIVIDMGAADGTYWLPAEIFPADTTDSIVWSCSDFAVADFAEANNEGARINALSVGKATITASTPDGSFSASCGLEVIDSSILPDITSVSFGQTDIVMDYFKGAVYVPFKIAPVNGDTEKLTARSLDRSVVTAVVDAEKKMLLLEPKGRGTTAVLLETEDENVYARLNVRVKRYTGKITGIKAAATGMNQVRLTWDAADDADGYIILRKGKQIGYTANTVFTDTGASADNFNYYWVLSYVKQDGRIIKSAPEGYVWALGRLVAQVKNLTAKQAGDSVELSWDAAEGANAYVILSKSGSADSAFRSSVQVKNTFYSDDPGKGVHFYWVYAVYANDEGRIFAAGKTSQYAWAMVQ